MARYNNNNSRGSIHTWFLLNNSIRAEISEEWRGERSDKRKQKKHFHPPFYNNATTFHKVFTLVYISVYTRIVVVVPPTTYAVSFKIFFFLYSRFFIIYNGQAEDDTQMIMTIII